MFSPLKLAQPSENSLILAENIGLADELTKFFESSQSDPLWLINTTRQRVTHALRNTRMIALRGLSTESSKPMNTVDWCDVLKTTDSRQLSIPIFAKTVKWLESAFKQAGAHHVEFGRIFFRTIQLVLQSTSISIVGSISNTSIGSIS